MWAGWREAARERGVHSPCRGEGATAGWRAGRGEQRTANVACMLVTRDVSQPEMSALKLCK